MKKTYELTVCTSRALILKGSADTCMFPLRHIHVHQPDILTTSTYMSGGSVSGGFGPSRFLRRFEGASCNAVKNERYWGRRKWQGDDVSDRKRSRTICRFRNSPFKI